ncbi:expressed unknown protein [Seminavis robusta]|uniref:Uncharacterized protein n=1 Tax=Seminavis robusta TaxID=568900 RepID=A0A9N8ENZ5_9STRA|nr:expressed unknown protein [Seminavis robusta]|eukprot:Sro1459_g274500.1 n/a (146) ;mRNA; f:12770-13207
MKFFDFADPASAMMDDPVDTSASASTGSGTIKKKDKKKKSRKNRSISPMASVRHSGWQRPSIKRSHSTSPRRRDGSSGWDNACMDASSSTALSNTSSHSHSHVSMQDHLEGIEAFCKVMQEAQPEHRARLISESLQRKQQKHSKK